jgi:AmiR/NasT family two-component response regulator
MDKRLPLTVLAEHILQQAEKTDQIQVAKKLLMEREGISEEKAYRHIVNFSKVHGCSVDEAAKKIRAAMERK